MALNTTVTGPGKVMSSTVSTRRFYTSETFIFPNPFGEGNITTQVPVENIEVVEQETREWYALTFEAAQSAVDANVQPEDETRLYTYANQIDNEVIPAYKLVRTEQKTTLTQETLFEDASDPTTFSPPSGEQESDPVTVTLTSSEGQWIYYETDEDEAKDPSVGSNRVMSGGTVEVPVPGQIKAFSIDIGKRASVISSATYTLAEEE